MNRRWPAQKPVPVRGRGGQVVGYLPLPFPIAALILVFWAATVGLDALPVAPWGYALFNRPTLAGHWVSTFTTPGGIDFALYLELERARDASGGALSDEQQGTELINGRATWCDDHGRHLDNVPLPGSVPTYTGYDGSAERVMLQIEAGNPPLVGLLSNHFEGRWRADTLTLKPASSF